jgi:large subunit ribosomal protein L13
MRTVEFDAEGQTLGRLATKIAITLRAKDMPTYRPDRLPEVSVVVKNGAKVKVTGSKESQKIYYRFSGYPGGLKQTKMPVMRATHPERIIELAVKRMLPNNRLRARFMKRLTVKA